MAPDTTPSAVSSPSPSTPSSRRSARALEIDTAKANGSKSAGAQLPRVASTKPDASTPPRSSHERHADEQSPLLAGRTSDDGDTDGNDSDVSPLSEGTWDPEVSEQQSKSVWYIMLLTFAALGLQIGWSVELSYGSPYLLSLGLTKSLLALVWIAGPLSGTIVQPYVGVKSDNCRIKWGRRKPFILGGAVATVLSLMTLAWAREIVGGFVGIFGVDRTSQGVKYAVMGFAVLFVYVLDFSINVLQAALRAFIVDCAPTHQQEDANAWFNRLSGVGNIIGMLAGFVNVAKIFPFLGNNQFQVLCAIACLVIASTTAVTCATVRERDPNLQGAPAENHGSVIAFFRSLYNSVRRLPPQIMKVCQVQFAAWIGWFPVLFYITTYIGEIYADPFFEANPHMTKEEIDKVMEKATRVGTFSMLIFAITTFASSVILPIIIPPTYTPPTPVRAALTPTTPTGATSSGFLVPKPSAHSDKHSFASKFHSALSYLQIRSLSLRRAWFLSHIMFAALMFLTFIVRSVTLATILLALVGIPWALTNWAPFALISSEISKRDAIRRGIIRAPPTRDGQLLAHGEDGAADQAGVVLGIHNVAIAAPQVIATLVSSLIFKWLQKPRGTPGDHSVAWVLRFGGCCALVAAWLTLRVGDEREGVEETE